MTLSPRRSIALGTALAVSVSLTGCCNCSCWWQGCCLNPRTWRTPAIPETLPLGSTVRAHYHTMETNGEAADFILHDCEFVQNTGELTPYGKDHVAEIGARMRSAPFPVLVERSENNSDPELDAHRRNIVAQVLYSMGNPDADQRTIVSPSYGKAINSQEAETDYYNFVFTRDGAGNGFNNQGTFGNAGVGGGGGGGIGFGR